MSAPVDVLAVLRRLCANVEFASLKREGREAVAALAELIDEAQRCCDGVGDLADLRAALRAVGGAV